MFFVFVFGLFVVVVFCLCFCFFSPKSTKGINWKKWKKY